MSQQNVEVVRALFEAWNARDMDAFRELYDPEAIMRMAQDWPEPGPYFGRAAIMREFEQLRQTWGSDAAEPIGDFIVWTVRKGRILAAEYFHEYAEALEAVGLRE
jgi:ketosteroid isomerase-like protein